MFHTGKPFEEQCEGCTMTQWNFQDATYLNEQGVSYAVICEGPWNEVGPFSGFMGYTLPWYSAHGADDPVLGRDYGSIAAFLRDGDRVFVTYETTGRGVEAIMGITAAARHDRLRAPGGVGGLARGLAAATDVLLLAP